MAEFSHTSVLLHETVDGLCIKPDGTYLDCTLGGGGHARLLASRLTTGKLIAIDQDKDALEFAKKRLFEFEKKIVFVNDNFENCEEIIDRFAGGRIDGAMIDLGVSSYQLDTPERGFSYHHDAPIDMRMNRDAALTGRAVVNEYPESALRRILRDYGEENRAAAIARAIVKAREISPVESTGQLADIIKSVFPVKERFEGKHPARRSFQAIRIEVNRELEVIPTTLRRLVSRLNVGGRLSVITFHSLEDRAVKETIKAMIDGCTCPHDFPVCVCGFKPSLKSITRKPITAKAEEQENNARARSAKLRIAERI